MIRLFGAAAVIALSLVGCQQVATFTAADASNATAMATRDSADPAAASRASCYSSWASLASGYAAVPANQMGVFTSVEAGIEVQSTLQLPACQAVGGQVLLWAMRHAPGGNFLP